MITWWQICWKKTHLRLDERISSDNNNDKDNEKDKDSANISFGYWFPYLQPIPQSLQLNTSPAKYIYSKKIPKSTVVPAFADQSNLYKMKPLESSFAILKFCFFCNPFIWGSHLWLWNMTNGSRSGVIRTPPVDCTSCDTGVQIMELFRGCGRRFHKRRCVAHCIHEWEEPPKHCGIVMTPPRRWQELFKDGMAYHSIPHCWYGIPHNNTLFVWHITM